MLTIYALAVGSALIDLALAAAALFLRPGEVDADRLVPAALAFCGGLMVKIVFGIALLPRFTSFGPVALAFVDLGLALPLLGLWTLWIGRRRPLAPRVRGTALVALALVAPAAWAMFVEPFLLVSERAEVPLDPARSLDRPLRVAVLADLQTRAVGDHEREAVRRILAFEPDLILIPGDLAQVWPRPPAEAVDEFHELVSLLEAPLGVFMCMGNTDDPEFVRRVLAGTNVRLLENEAVDVEGAALRIAGLGEDWRAPGAVTAAKNLEARHGAGDVRILLSHYPDAIAHLSGDSRIDLVVAGHTHGGQVHMPLFGPPLTLTTVPRQVAAGGLHEVDGRRVYVSRGVGAERTWAPRIRFLCRPEVSLLTLSTAAVP